MDTLLRLLSLARPFVCRRFKTFARVVSLTAVLALGAWMHWPHNALTAPVRTIGCPAWEWKLHDLEQDGRALLTDVVSRLPGTPPPTIPSQTAPMPKLPGC